MEQRKIHARARSAEVPWPWLVPVEDLVPANQRKAAIKPRPHLHPLPQGEESVAVTPARRSGSGVRASARSALKIQFKDGAPDGAGQEQISGIPLTRVHRRRHGRVVHRFPGGYQGIESVGSGMMVRGMGTAVAVDMRRL